MEWIEIMKAVILGIVEGITEWLPISSTGHMILVDEFLKLNMSPAFKEMFFVVIQLGAILAVVLLFWNKLFPFSLKRGIKIRPDIMSIWMKILVASVPAGIIGVFFNDKIDELFYNPWTVAITLIIYGVLFIIVENKNKGQAPRVRTLSSLDFRTVFIIGIFQMLALIPGTSRSGATIVGAMMIGTSRTVAAEFTFFLAIPVMFGASFLKLLKFGLAFTSIEVAVLLIGSVVAFIVSVLAIKFLMGYIKKHDFKVFGWYRIILGVTVAVYFLLI
ncbi:undecaprenyl-diphosphatase [Sporanaerobium hydrogeniformans]|uniref:Undecaprenyl-diphosphatase n=1 Tax=Sporanaerobium hydrogeniformans TaxID=3072179 RepID=A0AC61DC13_9FIRM|nr:undecaprenyl-diphosphate phosphatase [Sporanaerobium hydrogeniformans]PHV70087.1 undecaprenyl-diphosphatase [Sporanaerobium hydrogeniformans]